MPSTSTLVWSAVFLVLPVAFLAYVLATSGNPIAVFAALAWLLFGAVLAPFVRASPA